MSARRGAWATAAVLVVAALAVGLWWAKPWASEPAEADSSRDLVTAAVERGTLTDQVRLNGQLTYGEPAPLPSSSGILTALPTAGSTIALGQRVYERDGRPIVLLQGSRPFWRELSEGMNGEDVRQLQQNLAALGFDPGAVDGRFRAKTKSAVEAWQKSLGVEKTGVFAPSDVVVTPSPGIRIAQVTARLGATGESPATYTETTLRVVAKLTAAQARELTPGTAVTVTLPDGSEIESTIGAIDPGGQPGTKEGETTPPTATIDLPDQQKAAAAGPVAVPITVRAGAEQKETLVVPVTALLAAADGRYAVEVVRDGKVRRVPVEIGLVVDARVQILDSGSKGVKPLAEGDKVVLAR